MDPFTIMSSVLDEGIPVELGDGRFKPTSMKALKTLTEDRGKITYIGMSNPRRGGVQLAIVALEFFMFNPHGPDTDLCIMHYFKWNDILFNIVTIPVEKREEAEKIFTQALVRVVDGIPMVLGMENGVDKFPIEGSNVFTFENVNNHPNKNPFDKDFHICEDKLCKQITDGKIKKIPETWWRKGVN